MKVITFTADVDEKEGGIPAALKILDVEVNGLEDVTIFSLNDSLYPSRVKVPETLARVVVYQDKD